MAEAKDHASGMTSASASLRDTAKWLAGGIFATAAAVFAGSSLTNFGSLGPHRQAGRFYLALIGAVAGFAALGWLFRRVVSVLTMESASLTELAEAEADVSHQFHDVAKTVSKKYRDYFPEGTSTLKAAVEEFNKVKDPMSPDWVTAGEFSDIVSADASFLAVRKKFGNLTHDLYFAGALAAFGFGLFAWAANPPDSPPRPESGGVSVTVSVDGNRSAEYPPQDPAPATGGS